MDRGGAELAEPHLRSLEVGHEEDGPAPAVRDVAGGFDQTAMARVIAVGTVDAEAVGPGIDELSEGGSRGTGRTESGQDLRSSHARADEGIAPSWPQRCAGAGPPEGCGVIFASSWPSQPRGVVAKHAGLWSRRQRFESARG